MALLYSSLSFDDSNGCFSVNLHVGFHRYGTVDNNNRFQRSTNSMPWSTIAWYRSEGRSLSPASSGSSLAFAVRSLPRYLPSYLSVVTMSGRHITTIA